MKILSKYIFITVIIIFLRHMQKLKTKLDKNKWYIIFACFLLLLSVNILIRDLIFDCMNKRNILISIFLSVMTLILMVRVYNKLLQENKELKYRKINYEILSKMNSDLSELQHNLRYILMMEKIFIERGENNKGLKLINEYLNKLDKFKVVIYTGNSFFDFNLNNKLHEIIECDIDISVIILISQQDFYLNKYYSEYILNILDIYKKIAKKMTVCIKEKENKNIVNLTIKKVQEKVYFNNRFYELSYILKSMYIIEENEDLIIFKSIQNMN